MYCNENKNIYRNVTFIWTVLFSLKHCFYLGESVIIALKLTCIVYCPLILDLADPKYVSVSAYRRLKMLCLREVIAGTTV